MRLSGRLDPIDGRYHWQGTVFGALPDDVLTKRPQCALTVGDRTAEARITERTPQGRLLGDRRGRAALSPRRRRGRRTGPYRSRAPKQHDREDRADDARDQQRQPPVGAPQQARPTGRRPTPRSR